jgi:hypothetical protein
MHRIIVPALTAAAATLGWAATGSAQQPTAAERAPTRGFDRFLEAPKNALEIGVGIGYDQPFGNVRSGVHFSDMAAAGAQLELDLSYRFSPELAVGVFGTGAKYGSRAGMPPGNDISGATLGAQAAWHFRSLRGLDPWVTLGGGWRGYWEHVGTGLGTNSFSGLEIARARLGVDVRLNEQVAIAPVIGADLSMFLSESAAGTLGYKAIPGNFNTFVFAGVAGRFNFGPTTPTATMMGRR